MGGEITVLVTVIGELQAKIGNTFIYLGPMLNCKNCNLKKICSNMKKGGKYKVTKKRDVHHDCKIHENGVRVVEVEIEPRETTIETKLAIEGSVVSFKTNKCNNRSCIQFNLCHPVGIHEGRYKIIKVGKEIKCPTEQKLKEILIEE